MTLGEILVRPMDVAVAVRRSIPRHVVAVCEVLRHVQDCAARITASIEHTTVLIGSNRLMIPTCATHVQIGLLEVLCTMRVKRIASICHVSARIHDVVSVAGSVRLANSTEVDVGVAA